LHAEESIREASAAQAAARKAAGEAKAIKEEAELAMAEAVSRRAKIERDAAEKAAAAEAAATVAATEAAAARQAAERVAAEQEAVRRVTAEQTAVIQAAVEHVAAQTALGRVTQRLDPVTGTSASYHVVPVSPAGETAYAPGPDSIVARPSSFAGWLAAIIMGLVVGVAAGVAVRGGLPVSPTVTEKLTRANRLVREGDAATAIPLYVDVTNLAPELPIAYRHLGVAYSLTGDAERARRAYQSYVERASDRADAAAVQALLRRNQ
jgi:chemotaxis protein histidine kinase CheA